MVVSGQGNETSKVEFPEGSAGSSVQDELESGGKSWRQGSVTRLFQKRHKIKGVELLSSPRILL